jgi:signal transduction histidine kinase
VAAGCDALLWAIGWPRVLAQLAPLLYLYVACLHVARVRVAELRQLVGSAAALSVMASGLAGVFAALRLSVGEQLDLFVFNAFVMAFLLLLAFPRVQRAVEALIERLFLADRIELERSLQPLAERLAHLLTLDEILQELLSALENTSRLRTASVFLRDDKNLGFQQAGSVGLPPRARVSLMRHPVWVERLETSEVLLDAELRKARSAARHDAERERLDVLLATMRDLDAQIVLPLRSAGELVGFWALRDERSDESLANAEVQLLRRVADRLARSIQDSKTFERIRARDRLVALGEMASGLAHEIRNPLAAIQGAIQLLAPDRDGDGKARRPDDPEQAREFLGIIADEVRRLNAVVSQFLDYSRPAKAHLAPGDVNDILERTLRLLEAEIPASVTLETELERPLPRVICDPEQLRQVFLNLAINALQAMPRGGRLAISTRLARDELAVWREAPRRSDAVEVRFRDTGPGVPEEAREHIFVPFYTTKEKGTGLGLAICQRIVKAHGGSIVVRSGTAGQGAEFVISLPALWEEKPEPRPEERSDSRPRAPEPGRSRRRRRRRRPDRAL